MKIVYSEKHAQHDPQNFVVRGTRQRSAEQPPASGNTSFTRRYPRLVQRIAARHVRRK